ncbi:MAG: tRNA uridine-5-carboxymethylaminomethyl(34) synthesis GTPase MnmE [Chitinophagales bacterium]|nr:tRNA uridine-5-carboxymethylaminomethyl(34) synthesis GTPase MnmE [Chitinophagales bacterium]
MHYTINEDTIVALASGAGQAAIGMIRLSGPQSIAIADKVFSGSDLKTQATHTIQYGYIKDKDETIDEVMLAIFKAPRSYTTEDIVEITCHGSPYIEERIIELLVSKGARLAQPGEFTFRAFINGRIDLSQAEAVADLIASSSKASHQLALQQMRGGFSGEIKELRQQLIQFASLIELELDFSEEDVEFADRKSLTDLLEKIDDKIKELIESFKLGNVLKEGIPTVIAGRPNAGKSTLLNNLLKEERAIVSDIPGTTRDTIEEVIRLEGIPFRLIDTAGIREAADTIEAIGVERTMEKIEQSAILIYLFDAQSTTAEELQKDVDKLKSDNIHFILVGNKIDKIEDEELQKFRDFENVVYISSLKNENITALSTQMLNFVKTESKKEYSTIISNNRHVEALVKAGEAITEVRSGIETKVSGEMISLDIRRALDHLGEISGEVSTEDLLGEIFGSFCIGK